MSQMFRRLSCAVLLVVLFGGVSALAQTQNGRISGQVTDQQDLAIPGATVQVVSQDSTIKRDTQTDETGAYAVPLLSPGKYRVLIQAQGFGSAASDLITLEAGKSFTFNARLAVVAEKSEVEVTAGGISTSVELGTASLSTTLSRKEMTGYGLNGRNFSQLITLAPGVSNQTGQDEAKVGVAGSAKYSVNGGRVEYNTFEVDGIDVLNTSINTSRGQGQPLMVYPSIDSIQDMVVLTSNYNAMYGKSASGSVIVSTKSGTEKFHGNAYAFLRNEMFNARNYFDQPGRTPLYRRQDYGATLGGPLFIPHIYDKDKSKTYFFYSEEIRLEKTPVDYNQAVPTAAERKGDFRDVCPVTAVGGSGSYSSIPAAYADCPFKADPNSGSYAAYPTVVANYDSQAILNTGIIPQPNSNIGCNTTNPTGLARCYVASVSPPTYWREELFRVDHNLTPSERLSFRYVHDAWNTTTLTPQWGIVQNSFPTVENRLDGPGLNMVASLAQTLPHGFLNRIAFSYAIEHISLSPQPGQGLTSLSRPGMLDNPGSAQGWNQLANNPNCGTITGPAVTGGERQVLTGCSMGYIFKNGYGGNKMPGLVFQGTNGAYGGHGFAVDTGYAPWKQSNPTYTLRDDAGKTVGKHSLLFGVEATYVRQLELSAVTGANSGDLQGLLTFSNQQSRYSSGNAFADFLSGPGLIPLVTNPDGTTGQASALAGTAIKSYTQDSGQSEYDNRYKEVDLYLQDDYHVHPRLTLNAGLRVSFFGTWNNPKGTAYNWRPESFDPSLGGSIYVDPNNGYLVRKTGGSAGSIVPLSRTGPYSMNTLDPVIVNGLVRCGGSGTSSSCMTGHPFHPAPRVGFAWDPVGDGKTAIRGGYGMFWEHGTGYEANSGSLIGSAPLVLSQTQSNVPLGNPTVTGVGAYNLIGYSCQGGAAQCGSTTGLSGGVSFPLNVTSIPTKAVYTYIQQWSLSAQRELRKDTVFQLAYVGTKGTHLTAVRDLNQLTPLNSASNPFFPGQPITSSVCQSGTNNGVFSTSGSISATGVTTSPGIGPTNPGYVNMLLACTGNPGLSGNAGLSPDSVRPYPGFSNIISVANVADSTYHALQSTLRETTGPLTVGIAYTYSHSRDDSSDRASANFADSSNIKSNYASSDFDQRHLLNISYLYDLPLVRLFQGFTGLLGSSNDEEDAAGVPAASELSHSLKRFIDGWQISGITTYQTGTPFSVINGGSSIGTGSADNAGVGNGLGIGSYVDVIGSARGSKPIVPTGSNIGPLLYNPNAFAAPRGLTFGNSGRNSLNNPSRTNFNAALLKHFKAFSEHLDMEFRAEAYNLFNHTQFRIYDPSHPGNTGNNVANCFGDISTGYAAGASGCIAGNSFLHPVDAHDPRILQFGLRGSF